MLVKFPWGCGWPRLMRLVASEAPRQPATGRPPGYNEMGWNRLHYIDDPAGGSTRAAPAFHLRPDHDRLEDMAQAQATYFSLTR